MTSDWIGRLRLASGLVLAAYLVTHLLNHVLGLLGLEALETGRGRFLLLWRHPVGTPALYGALLVHPAIGLRSLVRWRHLRLPAREAWQLVRGLTVPALLATHVAGTRLALAVLLPTLALLGFVEGGREVSRRARERGPGAPAPWRRAAPRPRRGGPHGIRRHEVTVRSRAGPLVTRVTASARALGGGVGAG